MQEQNGAVNCKNCIIIEKGLTLLAQSSPPHTFREHAFKTATYLHNRHITHVLTFLSPYQKLYSKVPNYAFIKTFDFLCYPFLCPYNNHNIDFHSLPCVFLSYSATHKGYICFHTPFSRIYVARHVIFNEDVFLYSKNTLLSPTVSPTPPTLVSTNLSQQVTIISSTNFDNPSPTLITFHLLRLLIAPQLPHLPPLQPSSLFLLLTIKHLLLAHEQDNVTYLLHTIDLLTRVSIPWSLELVQTP